MSELIDKVSAILIAWDDDFIYTNKDVSAVAEEIIQMLKEEAKAILKGIDECETDSKDGWWETGTGAEFGESILNKIDRL